MFDSEIIKFENFLENNFRKQDCDSQLNSLFKSSFIVNNDETILLQISTSKFYDINNLSLLYQVYFEIFDYFTGSYNKFLKTYNQKDIMTENKIIIECGCVIEDFKSLMNIKDKDLRLKKLKVFLKKNEIEQDFQ